MNRKWIEIVAVLTSVFAMTFATYEQITQQSIQEKAIIRIDESRYKLKELDVKLEEAFKKSLSEVSPKSVEIVALNERFKDVYKKIKAVEDQTLGLRQAINPAKPDEILKIARLTDEIVTLKKDMSDLEKNMSQQQEEFKESVLRELKSSSDSTTLILVVLLPLVLNFLYTVWKDLRTGNKTSDQP